MEDSAKLALKKICCTCLSIDRKLSQLCKLKDGVNNLFFLMSVDSAAYETMLRSDLTRFHICWECNAFMRRQRQFIDQVRVAQKHLYQIVDAEIDIKPQNSLSKLISVYHNKYDKEFVYHNSAIDNFIDCGPDVDMNDDEIKSELHIDLVGTDYELANLSEGESITDNLDNIKVLENKFEIQPLSINKRKSTNAIKERDQVNDDIVDEEESIKEEDIISSELEEITVLQSEKETKSLENNCKSKNEINKATPKTSNVLKKNIGRNKSKVKREEEFIKEDGFSRIKMTDLELLESIASRKLENVYVLALNKCESCVEVFKDQIELEEHNTRLHSQKPKFIQCDICQVYIKFWWLSEHKSEHYLKYQCNLCSQVYYTVLDMLLHLKNIHDMKNVLTPFMLRKLKRRAVQTKPDLAPKTSSAADDAESAAADDCGYRCPECNKSFDNRYQRYKHIIKMHREGHKCGACGKTFAFRNTLNKHVLIHATPHPMEQCPTCGKMVRCDGAAAHARTHATRGTFQCVACDKRFTSRDSYQKHLKYSSRHAVTDVRKYKCTMCEKGFRTLRELNDHVNYNHMGKTQHKCPICHKALATQRCVKRHVSRAHHGIKEKSGDKILCQTCGKAFRDKKCLREHELIHTGEKPLSCELCARTFRQSACLYTHKRRVHKMAPKRLHVKHTGTDSGADSNVQDNKEIKDIN